MAYAVKNEEGNKFLLKKEIVQTQFPKCTFWMLDNY